MYILVNASNQPVKYPYLLSDLRLDFPNVSFPKTPSNQVLTEFSVFPVVSVTSPAFDDRTHKCFEGTPVFSNGVWMQTWIIENLTNEEVDNLTTQKARIVRAVRDQHLQESDWTQVADAAVDKAAWAQYRKLLRELPEQPGFPWNISWPSQP